MEFIVVNEDGSWTVQDGERKFAGLHVCDITPLLIRLQLERRRRDVQPTAA
jgi:hypothetical protein